MPEHCRPSHVIQPFSVFLPDKTHFKHSSNTMAWCHAMTSNGVMTSKCDIRWHIMSWRWIYIGQPIRSLKIMFFDMAALTFDLWPSNLSEISSRYTPLTKFSSVRQTVQPGDRWRRDRHTDGTNFIPLTADAGGNDTAAQTHVMVSWWFVVKHVMTQCHSPMLWSTWSNTGL